MSAVIVLLHRSAAHVLTDGAGYQADGRLLHLANKAWPMPHLSAVLTTRGASLALPLVANYFGAMDSFARLKERAGDILRCAVDEHAAIIGRSDTGTLVEAIVAGVGKDGPEAFFVSNRDGPLPAFTVIKAGPLAIMPATEATIAELRPIFDRGDPNRIDEVRDGLRMLEAQRANPDSVVGRPDLPPVYMVGGFAQLTTVTAESITQRILHRWPDRIGEKITP